MTRQFGRRKFLLYGSATLGTSILLKACAGGTDTTTSDASPAADAGSTDVAAAPSPSGDVIRVGVLHSLSGTMAISEQSVVDSTLLAIDEINANGGLLGKQIQPIVEDGASDWPTFAEKARKLIDEDQVVVIFGCWTSASRKAVLPVFEEKNHMLFYPVQYEGQECSRNIFYTGAAPNQQIEPAVEWLLENKGTDFYLVGSDYVFPRTANTIIKAQLADKGGTTVGEDYLPLGSTEVSPIIAKIRAALPDGGVIFNTMNGDSNVAFFTQLRGAGLNPDRYPVMSVSIAEEEVKAIGEDFLTGHYASWNYFMTVESPENEEFVSAFRSKYGESRVTNDPMEAAYISVNIWKQGVEAAGTEGTATDLDAVREAMYGIEFDAPGGPVQMNTNHHLSKTVRIGEIRDDGLFEIISETNGPVDPLPWNQFVAETQGYTCDWTRTDKPDPGRFQDA
ncbi:urea ABC transporter substrate-binding protein [Egbenema bharatensis]|uniref:urea ABC transporter substrate-binding protein n=1 Tax=Egbenema bharatensis TaxID=3463334 RepID=UPI003A8A9E79